MKSITRRAFFSSVILPTSLQQLFHGIFRDVLRAAAAGDDARAGSGGKTEIRTERLHDLEVLLGDADLRYLLHIAGGGLEDAAVLGDELLGFLPAGIRLTVARESRQ